MKFFPVSVSELIGSNSMFCFFDRLMPAMVITVMDLGQILAANRRFGQRIGMDGNYVLVS